MLCFNSPRYCGSRLLPVLLDRAKSSAAHSGGAENTGAENERPLLRYVRKVVFTDMMPCVINCFLLIPAINVYCA